MSFKIVFMGTPDFAVPSLKELINTYEVCAVFTQPDKPKGRGQKLQPPPVKEIAVQHAIPVFQPKRLRGDSDALALIKEIMPDLIIVIAYGQILPKEILEIPRLGCVNLHASLLPELRGAAPINWAIINGHRKTGNTTMLMAEGLDTGDMLLKNEVSIENTDTAGTLHDKLSISGVKLLIDTVEGLRQGSIQPLKQDDAHTSYASMLTKEHGHVDWSKSCEEVFNLVRGVNPWPGAFTSFRDGILKLHLVEPCTSSATTVKNAKAGEIISVSRNGIEVACGSGSILIKELQEAAGGKRMEVSAYLNGHELSSGEHFN